MKQQTSEGWVQATPSQGHGTDQTPSAATMEWGWSQPPLEGQPLEGQPLEELPQSQPQPLVQQPASPVPQVQEQPGCWLGLNWSC